MSRAWIAGWNMPGYLPETDPGHFDDFEDAKSYLMTEIDRFWDQDMDAQDRGDANETERVDAKWLDLHCNLGLTFAGDTPFAHATGDQSLVFWINAADPVEED